MKLQFILYLFLYIQTINGQTIPFQEDYKPKNYIVYHTNEAIIIDGLANEDVWNRAEWTDDFVDIQGKKKPKPVHRTRLKSIWDENFLYIYAYLDEPNVWAKLKQRDTVIFFDDDFEVFIDPDGDGCHYFEIEVNALNTVWDLMLMYPYRVDKLKKVLWNWDIRELKTAVHIDGSLNSPNDVDKGWALEMAIPLSTLHEFSQNNHAKDGNQWRINFSRVDWTLENASLKKAMNSSGKTLPESNWVWSPQGYINMHMPERWGYFQFSDQLVGTKKVSFIENEDEELKKSLWKLYHQMISYHKKNGSYTNDKQQFSFSDKLSCKSEYNIEISNYSFIFSVVSCSSKKLYTINEKGNLRSR